MRLVPGVMAAILVTSVASGSASAQVGTAFTYQGRLVDAGAAASGLYDLELRLWDAASAGTQVGTTLTLTNVTVTGGLFTVAVDFGAGTFAGARRWLAIGVRPGGTSGAFTTLAPRQELTPVANAIFATNAATVGGLACSNGDVAKWSGSGWTCGADLDTNSGGTVTSVTAGSGLSGGTIRFTGTVSVATGGITSAMIGTGAVTSAKIAAGAVGAAQINTAEVQARVGTMCPGGQFLRGLNSDGTVVCEGFDLPPTITTVDDPVNAVGTHSSMAIGTDGFPVISYFDSAAAALKVAKCVSAACTGATIITTVDDPANAVGYYTSIAIGTDGFPVISYADLTGALKVAKCVNAACTGATTITTVDDPVNTVGYYTSIAI